MEDGMEGAVSIRISHARLGHAVAIVVQFLAQISSGEWRRERRRSAEAGGWPAG